MVQCELGSVNFLMCQKECGAFNGVLIALIYGAQACECVAPQSVH